MEGVYASPAKEYSWIAVVIYRTRAGERGEKDRERGMEREKAQIIPIFYYYLGPFRKSSMLFNEQWRKINKEENDTKVIKAILVLKKNLLKKD